MKIDEGMVLEATLMHVGEGIREEGVWMLPLAGLQRSNPSGRGMV